MAASVIALNYATALIDALKSSEEVDRAGRDLEMVGALMKDVAGLARALDNPGLALEKRLALIEDLSRRIDAHPSTRRFLRLVVEKGRAAELPGMVAAFAEIRDARGEMARAEVVTAVKLDAAARGVWEKALARLTGGKVRVTYRTDPDIVGGALARVGSVVYDGSIRKQLERLRGTLLGE